MQARGEVNSRREKTKPPFLLQQFTGSTLNRSYYRSVDLSSLNLASGNTSDPSSDKESDLVQFPSILVSISLVDHTELCFVWGGCFVQDNKVRATHYQIWSPLALLSLHIRFARFLNLPSSRCFLPPPLLSASITSACSTKYINVYLALTFRTPTPSSEWITPEFGLVLSQSLIVADPRYSKELDTPRRTPRTSKWIRVSFGPYRTNDLFDRAQSRSRSSRGAWLDHQV